MSGPPTGNRGSRHPEEAPGAVLSRGARPGGGDAEALLRLFETHGTLVASGANAPLLLEDPSSVWLVTEGKVDVFAVRVVGDRPEGARNHLFTVPAGGLLLGMEPAWADEVGLLAVGIPGTTARLMELDRLVAGGREAFVREALERYVLAFSSALSQRGSPRFDALLAPGEELEVGEGSALATRRGVSWVKVLSGLLSFEGQEALLFGGDNGAFPLASGAWVRAAGGTRIRALAASDVEGEELWEGLRTFQRIALEWADLVLERDRSLDRERLGRRLLLDQNANRAALESLAEVLSPERRPPLDTTGGPLLTACRLVGEELHMSFVPAPSWEKVRKSLDDELRAVCRASAVGYRRVVLSPGWWTQDNGPLLGLVAQEPGDGEGDQAGGDGESQATVMAPVALLSEGPGRYLLADPGTGHRTPVDGETAAGIAPFGYQFYRSLPATRIQLKDVARYVAFRAWGDLRTLAFVGLLGAGLGLLLPILTGVVFDQVIPSADRGQLISVFAALAVAALAGTTFEITRSLAIIRLHARVSAGLQMAVLDRLVRLPLPFFRRFTAGDLALRASSISAIGNALSSATIGSLLSALVSAGSYVLLFVYSPMLALLATLILVVNMAFMAGTGYVSLRFSREQQEAEGKISGLVLQLLGGIAKLRVSGTEARAFAKWSREFQRQRELTYEVGRFQNNVEVFNAVLSILSTLLIFWAFTVLAGERGGLTTGQFLAFYAAFGSFMASGMSVTSTAISLLELIPLWERASPILEAEPEADPGRPDPGELTGRMEVSHLTFRYSEDGPVILQDVSFHAEPGEFIAIAGPSGAGKSTLLRVLLAFDLPENNSVFYDGHDLATIDVTAVRRQIGVVLQSSKVTAGDIHTNIVGASPVPLEAVWETARMAGLEDDLRDMPMGLHTVVPEGGGTLSGGQRQRLLIARALVHKPRILFFDEATSALDNRTQKIISESIESLHATRVVIAHRLSTIQHADRIYVMDRGKVVQSGTFAELMAQPGLFAELAARQEA